MSEQQKSCALCHAYLFEEDDVVYCPICGAPHHRECYNSLGKCALEELHGTDRQYDILKKREEEETAAKRDAEKKKAEQSHTETINTPFGTFTGIDFLGGVPKDYKLDEDVTADEAKNFVFSNTMRYIPKFKELSKKDKISWNFMAFLLPCSWFLSRKMYKGGIITGIISIVSTLLLHPFIQMINGLGINTTQPYNQIQQLITENMDKINPYIMLVALLGVLIAIATSIICALFGDYWYKLHTIKTIKEIKKTSLEPKEDIRKKGGVNLFLFFIGYIAVQYIPAIISIFI